MENGTPDKEFDLTIRNVGKATDYLFRQSPRAGFELPLKGFEGEFHFESRPVDGIIPFVAGGIGITPVLGQISSTDISQLRLLWTIGVHDIGLVADTFKTYPELPSATKLFVTGEEAEVDQEERDMLRKIENTGVKIERRRIQKKDLDEVNENKGVEEWYMCVGPGLKSRVLNWLVGRRIVFEDFNY